MGRRWQKSRIIYDIYVTMGGGSFQHSSNKLQRPLISTGITKK
uniref:Uncharacterized protein n=1 Tax=Rhizophora mucronata TaxID=61149 RepID=A0A2P2JBH7_RHIMU